MTVKWLNAVWLTSGRCGHGPNSIQPFSRLLTLNMFLEVFYWRKCGNLLLVRMNLGHSQSARRGKTTSRRSKSCRGCACGNVLFHRPIFQRHLRKKFNIGLHPAKLSDRFRERFSTFLLSFRKAELILVLHGWSKISRHESDAEGRKEGLFSKRWC